MVIKLVPEHVEGNKFLMSKIAKPIQVTCFNAEFYNSCKGLARAFLERANTSDVLSKNHVILTHIHSLIHEVLAVTTQAERQKLSASPSASET